ncbi:PTS glucitol/sorbitol transporter subunit IIA [Gemella sp. zg-1178]|uniref:PTS glucitol/sorbitol transporter subunit IIA n=1 Tax=Gemella sp. zg-1178 TaxID=2840372 RepID=UPI001C050609|nr:PTS glucitol/sorbitol transporter subunit IIA [Gemella sp. zg-1178]
MLVYENTVKEKGVLVKELGDSMFITFGDNAPETLKDYCYSIAIKPTKAKIKVGQRLIIDGSDYEIIAVGDIAEHNLVQLGHLTVNFSGDSNVLPGAIAVENKQCPVLEIGTVIRIEE